MTNKEMIIKALNDEFEDDCFSEGIIVQHINCPYRYSDNRCECKTQHSNFDLCSICKYKWLDNEVDE